VARNVLVHVGAIWYNNYLPTTMDLGIGVCLKNR